ncbi:hypothetical protein F5Y07DRAFT_361132 [Xylaria sp. FL0933]|nr:hypothetical protein F5Y07DRAFT_361132 [Xylaria sp. FL0933]
MSPSTAAPGQYTTQLSGVKHSTLPGGITSASTAESTAVPLGIKRPTFPVVIGITRGLFAKTDPSQLSDGFIGDPSSGTSPNCTEAQVFTLGSGYLQSMDKLVSVDPGVKYVDLNKAFGGEIAYGLASEDGFLVWRNSAFYKGTAGFCKAMNGRIYATFSDAGGPAGCVKVYLTV